MRYVARQILPIAAEINATTRNVTAVQNRSPPVRNQTRMAANAAMGNAKRKPITAIITKPMTTKIISKISSCVGSVGMAICRAVKNDKKFTSQLKKKFWGVFNGLLHALNG